MKEIKKKALIENITEITLIADEYMEAAGVPKEVMIAIDIAIDELAGNVCNYAYADSDTPGDITIRMDMEEPKTIVFSFEDGGVPYNPLAKKDPDVSLSLEERKIGGLGIFIVKKSMDSFVYEYKDGKNIVTIKKNF